MEVSIFGVKFNIYEVTSEDNVTFDEFFKMSSHRQILCLGSALVSKCAGYTHYREMPSDLTPQKFSILCIASFDGTENKKYRRDALKMARYAIGEWNG